MQFQRYILTFVAILGVAATASASERRYTYTYQTGVLNPGDIEVEPWTTLKTGRKDYYKRFDHRVEFEVGLTERLQTAFYVNLKSVTQDTATGGRDEEFSYNGVSSEWKLKLLDPVADAIGLALYGELGYGPDEVELEGKLLVDKRFGDFLAAFNVVGEVEWEYGPDETVQELVLELDAGLAYFVTDAITVGVEARNHNEFVAGDYEHSALFAGPVLSYADKGWWAAMSVMPQVRDLKNGGINKEEHERIEARLLFGMHL